MASPDVGPHPILNDPNDRGPAINIAAWILMLCMCIAVLIKIISKLMQARTIHLDDVLLLSAMMLVVGQTICINISISYGGGRHFSDISNHEMDKLQQAVYASDFFFVGSLFLAKAALLAFIRTLARKKYSLRAVQILWVALGIWAIVCILGFAFQCGVSQPWRIFRDTCFNRMAFWGWVEGANMFLDLCLIVLPTYILYDLNMAVGLKLPMIAAFSARFIMLPIVILRLVYLKQTLLSTDPTFNGFLATIFTQIELNLSVALVALPFVKTFWDRLQHGLFTMDLRHGPQRERTLYQQYSTKVGSVDASASGNASIRQTRLPPTTSISEHLANSFRLKSISSSLSPFSSHRRPSKFEESHEAEFKDKSRQKRNPDQPQHTPQPRLETIRWDGGCRSKHMRLSELSPTDLPSKHVSSEEITAASSSTSSHEIAPDQVLIRDGENSSDDGGRS